MYTRTALFEGMSSTAVDRSSFENQHNEVHVAVGGIHPVGHFANFPYSGFDPIFMLHHLRYRPSCCSVASHTLQRINVHQHLHFAGWRVCNIAGDEYLRR